MRIVVTLLLILFLLYNCNNKTEEEVNAVTASFKSTMLAEVNELRRTGCYCGSEWFPPVEALSWNSLLEEAAFRHVKDMASNDHFDHKGTDGSHIKDRINDTGYAWSGIGENIAAGQHSIKEVVKGWKTSPPHCKNMMNPNFVELGAAEKDLFWTQNFGNPR